MTAVFYLAGIALFVLVLSVVTALIERFAPDAIDRLARKVFP
jgi:hypothetical protein